MTLNDIKLSKVGFLAHFSQFWAAAHVSKVNCDKMVRDRLRHLCEKKTAKAVARRISFAQIICRIGPITVEIYYIWLLLQL